MQASDARKRRALAFVENAKRAHSVIALREVRRRWLLRAPASPHLTPRSLIQTAEHRRDELAPQVSGLTCMQLS